MNEHPKIAIFYHSVLDLGETPINETFAIDLLCSQMLSLKKSGLADASESITVGLHSSDAKIELARKLIPEKATLFHHDSNLKSELPTIDVLRRWLPGHEDWVVFYFHAKGVSKPDHPASAPWRACMERHCLWNWRLCVKDMVNGCDTVGAHWLTPEQYPTLVKYPFWGGNFWWAKASFLMTLPELPNTTPHFFTDRYWAESWIGMGPQRPKVFDYAPHWPDTKPCSDLSE